MLTQAELQEMFEYREDGVLLRRHDTTGKNNKAGNVVGFWPKEPLERSNRYVTTRIRKKNYRVHRLIYLYHHGNLPEQVDHINGNTLDNRIENLRPCDPSQSSANRTLFKSSKSGYKGVSWHDRIGKWLAYVDYGKKRQHVGYFDDPLVAAESARQVRAELHGEFAKHA